jgi:hypothetical protein
MKNIIETIDLQRRVRKNAFRKAAQLFGERNMERWGFDKPTTNQIRGVFRLGYDKLSKTHKNVKWLNPIAPPNWITKLDYICARGGKPIVQELNNIIKSLGDEELSEVEEIGENRE